MNNKGQVFILFIIVLPIIVLVLINISMASYKRINFRNIDKTIYDNLNIMIKNDDVDVDKLRKVLKMDFDNINITERDNDIFIEYEVYNKKIKYCLIDKRIKKEGECL